MKFVRTGRFIEQAHNSLVDYLADGYIDYEDGKTCICKLGFIHDYDLFGEGKFYPSYAFVLDHYEGDVHYESEKIDIVNERYLEIRDDDYEYERTVI